MKRPAPQPPVQPVGNVQPAPVILLQPQPRYIPQGQQNYSPARQQYLPQGYGQQNYSPARQQYVQPGYGQQNYSPARQQYVQPGYGQQNYPPARQQYVQPGYGQQNHPPARQQFVQQGQNQYLPPRPQGGQQQYMPQGRPNPIVPNQYQANGALAPRFDYPREERQQFQQPTPRSFEDDVTQSMIIKQFEIQRQIDVENGRNVARNQPDVATIKLEEVRVWTQPLVPANPQVARSGSGSPAHRTNQVQVQPNPAGQPTNLTKPKKLFFEEYI
ncbi:MAG: hypothetical protein KF874_13270 [Rhizobiaceae bacterium]|nr:hypothetical protein [Rhizobiaceae bacterium]